MILEGDLNMIKSFRSTKILYYIISFFGAVFIWMKMLLDNNFYLGGLVAIIWIIAISLIMKSFAWMKMNKIINIMRDDCNLEEYIRILNELLSHCKDRKSRTLLMLNLSTGYLNAGDRDYAQQTLDHIDKTGKGQLGAAYRVSYYNNLVSYFFMINDIENVIVSMEKLKLALNNKNLRRVFRNQFLYLYSDAESLLNITNNIYDGAEQLFDDVLVREKHMLSKVYAKYILGIIYLHDNKLSEAREVFEFAAKNGGDSRFVEMAKEQLENLS